MEKNTHSTAFSMSTSSKHRKELFPPSSSVINLVVSAQRDMIFDPVAKEPVNDTLLTRGCFTRCVPVTPSPVSTLKTPGGTPARLMSLAIARIDRGVISLGFTICNQC